MTSRDELSAARVNRATGAMDVKPADLLRAMAHDIETGELVCDGLILIYANRPKDGPWEYGAYRCGMMRDQEIVALAMTQHRALDTWRHG